MTTTDDKKSEPLHGPNLILDVENFGPIAEAKNIEFKPITVFVGPSNTGKTYLAMLMHAVLRAKLLSKASFAFAADASTNKPDFYQDKRFNRFVEDVRPWIDGEYGLPKSRGFESGYDIPFSYFGPDSRAFLTYATQRFLEDYIRDANRTIARYFDVDNPRHLTNQSDSGDKRLSITLRDTHPELDLSLIDRRIRAFVPSDVLGITIEIEEGLNSPVQVDGEFVITADHEFTIQDFAEASVSHFPSTYYFRAGRTGLIDAYRELAATLIERAATNSNLARTNKHLAVSVATSEFLQSIVRLSSRSVRTPLSPNMGKLADLLEDCVLGGKIIVKEPAGITYFEFKKDEVTVPLDRASSMVTELAPIVLFIRSFIRDGDLLIIDEPEAHLHPEAQQQMAAALAFMVRSGLRVLITTHSHYMVEQLSAFVNASKLDEKTRKRALALGGALGKEDIYLNEDETAVYSFAFSEEHSGSVVKEIFMGEEYEYGPDDHSDATVDQFNRLQRVLEARETAESNGVD